MDECACSDVNYGNIVEKENLLCLEGSGENNYPTKIVIGNKAVLI